ncbi:MAG: endonuclease/exonuclease/phosphatase family protein [Pirellulales bacterium]
MISESRFDSVASRLLLPALIGWMLATPTDAAVTVMTQNMYVGFDVGQYVADVSANPGNVVTLTTTAYAQVLASDIAARADAIALEVHQKRPALIGLQEVSLFRSAPFDGPGAPHATTVEIDFLPTMLNALSARGLNYAAVATVQNVDAEFPRLIGFDANGPILQDIRVTDHDVILARTDLPLSEFQVSNPQSGNFAVFGSALGVNFLRGWTSVDVEAGGADFRFFNTHLDPVSAAQVLQAAELLAGPTNSSLPTILVGDFNSPADGSGSSTYASLIGAGFTDAWSVIHPGDPGYTCCQDANLLNNPSELSQRIDLILYRNGPLALEADIVGEALDDRTPSGLWPADHAGVVATLRVPEPSSALFAIVAALGLMIFVPRLNRP